MNHKIKIQVFTFGVFLIFFYTQINGQDSWDSWNERYSEINVFTVLKYEKAYADSININSNESKYYVRMDNYRFNAIYLGEKRKIDEDVKKSMYRVYKLLGKPDYLSLIENLSSEFKFKIDNEIFWIPMQNILEDAFNNEANRNDTVLLYCLFLNENSETKGLLNNFLISEFIVLGE